MLRRAFCACALAFTGPAAAADFQFEGYGDLRLIVPPSTGSYLDGELGKLRYGDDDNAFQPGDLVGEGRVLVTPELMATATARVNADYGPAADLLEAYALYSPASATRWHWSVKVGAFFPPLSLENEQVGWTSFWTITPSAIDSWVGGELRVIGTEGTLQWRRESGTLTLSAALFSDNDPAGVMIANRGWTFDDRVAGLFERERLPDAAFGSPQPAYAHLFTEIDGRPGWYLDLSWEPADVGGFEIMRYDNDADPRATQGGRIAWHTRFWDVGFQKQLGKLTLLSQGMSGTTTIEPSPAFHQTTDFRSAYALMGYDMDAWWAAARVDVFQTRTTASFPSSLNEDGHSYTLSLSWLARNGLRFTGELLSVDDTRQERAAAGETPHQVETQFQLLARVYF
jgi:hypothetical protein